MFIKTLQKKILHTMKVKELVAYYLSSVQGGNVNLFKTTVSGSVYHIIPQLLRYYINDKNALTS
jgi:hypothetical protein